MTKREWRRIRETNEPLWSPEGTRSALVVPEAIGGSASVTTAAWHQAGISSRRRSACDHGRDTGGTVEVPYPETETQTETDVG